MVQRIFILLIIGLISFQRLAAQPCGNNYNYRRAIRVSNLSNTEQSDQLVEIHFDALQLIGNHKMLSDCSDIIFTDFEGFPLQHWIDEENLKTNHQGAWILLKTVPAEGTTIYMFYGNPAAISTSDASIFHWFDPLNNLDRWEECQNTELNTGKLRLLNGDVIRTLAAVPHNFAIDAYVSDAGSTGLSVISLGQFHDDNQGYALNYIPDDPGDGVFQLAQTLGNCPLTETVILTSNRVSPLGVWSFSWNEGTNEIAGASPYMALNAGVAPAGFSAAKGFIGVEGFGWIELDWVRIREINDYGITAELSPDEIFVNEGVILNLSSNAPFCAGDENALTMNATYIEGADYQWRDPAGNILQGNGHVMNIPNVASGNSGIYTVVVDMATTNCFSKTGRLQVVIDPPVGIGQISSDITVCATSNSGEIRLQNYTGKVAGWQYRINNSGLWLDQITEEDFIEYSDLKETHSFRARIESGTCTPEMSDISTVTVSPETQPGILPDDFTVCEGSTGTLSLLDYTGDVQYWESSTDGTNWDHIDFQNSIYQYTSITDSAWFRVYVESGVCDLMSTHPVLLAVSPATRGGSVQGGTFACAYSNHDSLFQRNHTGDILRWEFGPGTTGPWSENSSHENYFIYQGLTNTTYYRTLIESPGCSQEYSEIDSVIVESIPDAGILPDTIRECATRNSGTIFLNDYKGKVVQWVHSYDNNSWFLRDHSFDTLNYENLIQNTFYKAIVNSPHEVCIPDTSNKTSLRVSPTTLAGNLYANRTVVCALQNRESIRINGEEGEVQYWESSPNGLSPWLKIQNSTDSLIFDNLQATTFYRAILKSGVCSTEKTDSLQIQVDRESVGGTVLGSTEVCELVNSGEINVLNYAGTPYKWESSPDNESWTTYPFASGNTLQYDSLPDTTYFRVMVKNGQCPVDTSTVAKITVNPLPDVAFQVNSVNLGDPTFFQNNSTISGGAIQNWLWDFGDTESSVSENPSHTYTNEGNYSVRLTAFSNKGCVDSASALSIVFGLPDVNFTFENVCLYYPVEFTNTSVLNGAVYLWDFGDNTPESSGLHATHTYTSPGDYQVRLKAVSASGGVDSVVKTVSVYQRALPAFKTENICQGETASFANHTTPVSLNITCQWDFGNGQTDTRTDPEMQYEHAGSYLVKLIVVTHQGCTDSLNKIVTVYPIPKADFTVEDVPYRQPSSFFNQSSIPYGNLSYQWEFGDGELSDSIHPVYTYGAAGVYSVRHTALSDSGCMSSVEKTVRIFDLPLANFSFQDVCFQDSMVFVNESFISSGSLSFEWHFGDGNSSDQFSPVHEYAAPGNYLTTLYCVSDNGARDTVEKRVNVFELPHPDFSFNEACDGYTTFFENLSYAENDEISGSLWDFGDGTNSIQINPQNEYLNPGIYNVNLEVTSANGCIQNISKPVILHHNPLANFDAGDVCLGSYTKFVNATEIDISNRPYTVFYQWDMGNGSTSILKDPQIRYDDPGVYRVQLTASTDAGCYDTLVRYIEVYSLPEAQAGKDTTVTKGFPVTLHAAGGDIYEWSPETGLSDISIPDPEARPMETMAYSLRVIDENSCVNYDTLRVIVKDEMKIIPSNILTPNNNNENDTWNIINIDSYPEAEIMVFDRWGKLIYEMEDYRNDWAGLNNKGDILPDGTYYYVIALDHEKNTIYKGAITIMRDR